MRCKHPSLRKIRIRHHLVSQGDRLKIDPATLRTNMAYQPIENYGVIGDLHSVALVGMNGSIDWYCFPHFDSPSVFGRILDDKKGGRFQISAGPDGVRQKQSYWPSTNVLVTR